MKMSSIALAPYKVNDNFRNNLTNKSIEYMAGGLPILYSIDDGYLANLLNRYECGFTYGNNIERLSNCIDYLLKTPKQMKQIGRNARSLYENEFQANSVYNDIVDFLENVVIEYRKNHW